MLVSFITDVSDFIELLIKESSSDIDFDDSSQSALDNDSDGSLSSCDTDSDCSKTSSDGDNDDSYISSFYMWQTKESLSKS